MKNIFVKSLAVVTSTLLSINALAADITGRLISGETSEPVDFATISLINPLTDEMLPGGTLSDGDGRFMLSGLTPGHYIVRISFIGMDNQDMDIMLTDKGIDLGQIALTPDSELLETVVVIGDRRRMSIDPEHLVYDVRANIASAGANAVDLISVIPTVSVNADGDIALRGKPDVKVLINGKEMGMNDDNRAQFLRQIPAASVKNIEVMSNPSSRHGAEGTAGIINIVLREDSRHGTYGSADAAVDSRGSVNANFNINYNEGKFETFAGIGLKSDRHPGGVTSRRNYDDGLYLNSDGKIHTNENSAFLRLGTNYLPDENNTIYLSAIGTIGHKWSHTTTYHLSDLPGQWHENHNLMRESGDSRGVNVMLGYKHDFGAEHSLDMNVSYNLWQGPDDNRSYEVATSSDGSVESIVRTQHEDVNISNIEAAADYTVRLFPELLLEAGYKGNYNHENTPASYGSGPTDNDQSPLDALYNRFKYNTDITAFYLNLSGSYSNITYSAGLRAEAWHTTTRSLDYGQTDADVPESSRNDFSLFPSASFGWQITDNDQLLLMYSRRIRRPFGPQLNTFENISDPSEVHIGNPLIQPEYSDAVELSYVMGRGDQTFTATAYLKTGSDMISHVSFLAPMISDPDVNTMYYGHANVGNMLNSGILLIATNNLFKRLNITTSANLYNSHLKAWNTEYPLHGGLYTVSGKRQNRFVADISCMASLRLPWDLTFQATGRYRSKAVTAQGVEDYTWDVEAGLRKSLGNWTLSMLCKDIFNSARSCDILYGDGYRQKISKWNGGRTFRLSIAFNFGSTHDHDHGHVHHNEIDTGGYGSSSHDHHHH